MEAAKTGRTNTMVMVLTPLIISMTTGSLSWATHSSCPLEMGCAGHSLEVLGQHDPVPLLAYAYAYLSPFKDHGGKNSPQNQLQPATIMSAHSPANWNHPDRDTCISPGAPRSGKFLSGWEVWGPTGRKVKLRQYLGPLRRKRISLP